MNDQNVHAPANSFNPSSVPPLISAGASPGMAGPGAPGITDALDTAFNAFSSLDRFSRKFWGAVGSTIKAGATAAVATAVGPAFSPVPAPVPATDSGAGERRWLSVNRTPMGDAQLQLLDEAFGRSMSNGAYWYDKISGAWGREGSGPCGKIKPGLDFCGPLRADASRGQSGVFVNGRETGLWESLRLKWITACPRGRYQLDAEDNFWVERGPFIGNLKTMAAQKAMLVGAVVVAQSIANGARPFLRTVL